MKLGDIFKSSFFRAADVDSPRLLTIKSASVEEVGRGKDAEDKLVVRFHEDDRGLVCNVTNARSIEKIALSDDTGDWPGKKVVLWNDPSASYGGSNGGIRVRAPKVKRLEPEPQLTLEEEGEASF